MKFGKEVCGIAMEAGRKTAELRIGGMTCAACESKIERKLRSTAGVASAEVRLGAGTAVVVYDADSITLKEIAARIEGLGYSVLADGDAAPRGEGAVGVLLLFLAAYMLLRHFGPAGAFGAFPTAEAGMRYGLLPVIGILTSLHCAAMCGGLNLSRCIPRAPARDADGKFAALRPSFLYNLGRVLSYTAIGGAVGALGSVLTPSGAFRGAVQLLAGAFMIVVGLNLLGLFPRLRSLVPRLPRGLADRIGAEKGKSGSPLIVGLLNGLMPCGPLQAMQLYALSSGSLASGALSMFLFSVGTVPLMFGLGALSSVLGGKFTRKVTTIGASLVVVLGLSMLSQGFGLSGFSFNFMGGGAGGETADVAVVEDGRQIVNSTLSPGKYPAITVRAGVPVEWTIDAPQGSINGCNNRFILPEYGIEHSFKTGENRIAFTPAEAGRFSYSCWMGMIRGSVTVVEDAAADGAARSS
ncbi:MAG: sulfite exporter TauE/SafE family protein [Clostridiales Family XIII bacterium]|jgi:sulfite exporter TauE/SafE/copper chaperone CopZ|nr:sulfite exporter TauE/SafE family protein [Clostridiales Family XIII bacterium]